MLLASRVHCLRDLCQARRRLWGTTWTTLCRLAVGVVESCVHPLERLFGLRHGLGGSPLFDGHRRCDRFTQCMLPMAEVRRVRRPEVMCNIRQQSWGLVAGRLHDPTVEPRQSLFHECLPGVLSACLRRLLQHNRVAHRRDPHQA
jgi:hypothetical protein